MTDNRAEGCGLLTAPDPREDEAYARVLQPLLEVDLAGALAGDQRAVVAYVDAWRAARAGLLSEVMASCPSLRLPPMTLEALDSEALQAPFSVWRLVVDDARSGLALDLIARLRNVLADSASPLRFASRTATSRTAMSEADRQDARRFYRQVAATLEGRSTMAAQIVDAFSLNTAELGRLFGVSRQAAGQWLRSDVPADRKGKAATVLAIADLLSHRLKPGRLAGVARRPAAEYGGLTMLAMIAADRHAELLDSVRASFDFSKTA